MKLIHKILIVIVAFIAALVYFGSGINERFFGNASDTVPMSAATFPTIYIQVQDNEFNRLHGYASNLDHMLIRESITPITSDREFTVMIDENESNVKKLKYEAKTLKTSSVVWAMTKKELTRFFNSSSYMLNAGLGLVYSVGMTIMIVVGMGSKSAEAAAAAAPGETGFL